MLMNQVVAVAVLDLGEAIEIKALLNNLGVVAIRVNQVVCRKARTGLAHPDSGGVIEIRRLTGVQVRQAIATVIRVRCSRGPVKFRQRIAIVVIGISA